jgi:hypothetical protein
MLPLGRSDPSSRRSARARRRAPAAEQPGWTCAAWCCWSGAGWRWLASQEGDPPSCPSSRWVKAASRALACLDLDPAGAASPSGCWRLGEPSRKCSPLCCITADPELQQDNRVKKPGLGPRPGLSLWPLGPRPGRAAGLPARIAAPATPAGPAAAHRAHPPGPGTGGWQAAPLLLSG